MRRVGWLHFGAREPRIGVLLRGVSRAAAAGEPTTQLLDLAARHLLEAAAGERAGVWLRNAGPEETLEGIVLEADGGTAVEAWRRLDVGAPFMPVLMESPAAVRVDVNRVAWASMLAPLAGMATAVWIPLRVKESTLGLAMVAFESARSSVDLGIMQGVADELALAVALREREAALAKLERERAESEAALASHPAMVVAQERLQREAAEAEARAQTLWEAGPGLVLLLDAEGVVQQASRQARQRFELPAERLGRVCLEELFAPAAREAVTAWRAKVRAGPACGNCAIEAQAASGVVVRFSVPTVPVTGLPENSLFVVCEDVTALRQTEERAARAERELRSVLDAVESGVLLLDTEGRVRFTNQRFGQLLGLDAHSAAGLGSFASLVGALQGRFRDAEAFAARWRALVEHGEEAAWDELELLRPARKVLERFARPVVGAEGKRIGWLEVYRDLTGQRLIHSKLLQTEKMAAVGQLVSGIAHELNNPLTSIMGYAQLLLGHPRRERGDDAQKIYQEAERARRIVKNLLLFARDPAQRDPAQRNRPVDLNEIIERTLALRSYELKVENITVELELAPDLPETLADAHQLQQVVLNLIVNAEQAILHGRGTGHIRVRTSRVAHDSALAEQGRLAMEVADDGPGISPEIASRIFDPFFTTKPVGQGTGLGLSIAYGIVHEHGGEISFESQPGQGARFTVELPIVAAPREKPAAAPAERRAVRTLPGRRVLVVEDEPTVAQLIADVLREEGHEVDVVLESPEGLNRLAQQSYDLVVCDLKMPRVGGREFYQALVRAGSPLQRRIVFVTGDTLAPHTLKFLEETHLPYLAKPFLVEELKLAIQQVLGGNGAGAARPERERVVRPVAGDPAPRDAVTEQRWSRR